MAKATTNTPKTLIAENRRARFNYAIEEDMEAGIQLVGTEVKALREGRANIAEAYVSVDSQFNHLPTRPRKLLLKRREINVLLGETQRKGRTIVPLKMYFNKVGKAKLLIGVGAGKQNHDKRDVQKKRDWQKQKARIMRDRG